MTGSSEDRYLNPLFLELPYLRFLDLFRIIIGINGYIQLEPEILKELWTPTGEKYGGLMDQSSPMRIQGQSAPPLKNIADILPTITFAMLDHPY